MVADTPISAPQLPPSGPELAPMLPPEDGALAPQGQPGGEIESYPMPTHRRGVQVASAGRVGADMLDQVRKMAQVNPSAFEGAKRMWDPGTATRILEANGLPREFEKYSGAINLERIQAPEDTLRLIDDISRALPGETAGARRGVVSDADALAFAQEVGMNPAELLGRHVGEAWNKERLTAARFLLTDTRERASALAAKVRGGQATAEEMADFRRTLAVYAGMQLQVQGLASESGRALQSFNIMARSGVLRQTELNELLQASGGVEQVQRMADLFLNLDTPAKKAAFARKAHAATGFDMAFEYWVNSLLSSPSTHAVNITSNAMFALWQIPERAVAGLNGGGPIKLSEAAAQAYGAVEGFRDGLRVLGQVLRTGEPVSVGSKIEMRAGPAITAANVQNLINRGGAALHLTSLEQMQLAGPVGAAIDLLGSALRVPGRFLIAEDEFFKAVAYRMELRAQAHRAALSQGAPDVAARTQEIVSAVAPARYDTTGAILQKITDEGLEGVHLEADAAGRYATFQTQLGQFGTHIGLARAHGYGMRYIVPFLKTPINILKRAGERSPFALAMPSFWADVGAGGAKRQLAMARLELGSLVAASVAYQVATQGDAETTQGFFITGAEPKDPAARATWERLGMQPYSVRDPSGKWHAYNRMDPLGWTIGVMADMTNIISLYNDSEGVDGDEELAETAAAVVGAISNNILSKTYLQGVADFTDMFTSYDPEKWLKYVQRYASTWMPMSSAQGFVARQMAPYVPMVDSLKDRICARTPGCAADLAAKRNVWGEPITYAGGIVSMTRMDKSNPVDAEFMRLEWFPTMPNRKQQGVELTTFEYSRWMELSGSLRLPGEASFEGTKLGGKTLREAVGSIMGSTLYQRLPDGTDPPGGKVLMLEQVFESYRKLGWLALIQESPDLRGRLAKRMAESVNAKGATPSEGTSEEVIRRRLDGLSIKSRPGVTED